MNKRVYTLKVFRYLCILLSLFIILVYTIKK